MLNFAFDYMIQIQFSFSASALLGEVVDTTYQLIVYSSKVKEVASAQVATCLYSENTRASDFVNALYGKDLFTFGWLKVDNIGMCSLFIHILTFLFNWDNDHYIRE